MSLFRLLAIAIALISIVNFASLSIAHRNWGDPAPHVTPARKSLQLPIIANPQCIVFHHIPKSGGTSFSHNLLEVIASKLGWIYNEWYHFSNQKGDVDPLLYGTALESNATMTSRIIHAGHITPKFWNLTATDTCFKVTILREPVDRVVSAFYYHKHRDEQWQTCLEPNGISKTDTMKRCLYYFQYQNDMTRQLSGRTRVWNMYIREKWINDVNAEYVEAAKINLLKMNAICFLSELDKCAKRIAKVFGTEYLPPNEDTKSLQNVGERRKKVTPEVQSMIRAANSFDLELYQWAWDHFSLSYRS